MNLFSRVKKPFGLAVLVLTLVLSGAFLPSSRVSSSSSITGHSTRFFPTAVQVTYYSSASYTTVVGIREISCNGTSRLTGTTSQYYQTEIINTCCGSETC